MKERSGHPEQSAAAEITSQCLAGRTRLLNRAITGMFDERLRPAGITAGQLTTLSVIDQNGSIAPGVLAQRLMMEKSTISRNLGRMERNGWVRIKDGESAHSQGVEITAKGRRKLDATLPAWRKAQAEVAKMLGKAGAKGLMDSFDRVRNQQDHK